MAPLCVFGDGPPPLPEIGLYLNGWRFDTTNLLSLRGDAPLAQQGVQLVETWQTNAARLSGPEPVYLQYNTVEANGVQNLTVPRGSIWFWFRPMWSSTNLGGTGPGSSARLIEIGAFSEEASYGWLSLYLNAAGTHMYFSGQSNGAGALYLQAPIAWTSNTWHLVVLDYTETNTLLNIDGVRATNGSGVAYWPSPSVMSNGFFVGSDSSGSNIARGDFELLRTYDGPTDALIYSSYYSNTLAKIQAWESGGGDGLLAGDGGDFNLLDGGDGGEGFGPGSGPMLAAPAMEGTNFLATITGGEDGVWYDFFRGTNFIGNSGTNSQWTWLGQGTNSGRYALPELPEPNAFYVLGTPEDSDADGLTDAYEALVQKTGQQNPDTDRDGLSDWYELNVSHTDPFTAELAPSFLNRTIMRCPVSF